MSSDKVLYGQAFAILALASSVRSVACGWLLGLTAARDGALMACRAAATLPTLQPPMCLQSSLPGPQVRPSVGRRLCREQGPPRL